MANTKPLPQHHSYDWSSGDHRSIEVRLAVRRDDIASILQIDTTESETVRITGGKRPGDRSVAAYIEHRNSCLGFKLVPKIEFALDEIKGALVRFVAEVSNLNARASENVVRSTLVAIAERDDITEGEVENLDLSVRESLARHYPGGRKNFRPGTMWPELVIEAARFAVSDFQKPGRGRPKGSVNYAAKNLAHELFVIFSRYSPTPPTRSSVNRKVKGEVVSREEGGKLLSFFRCVIDALPDDYRDVVTRSNGDLPSLIRRALPPST